MNERTSLTAASSLVICSVSLLVEAFHWQSFVKVVLARRFNVDVAPALTEMLPAGRFFHEIFDEALNGQGIHLAIVCLGLASQ